MHALGYISPHGAYLHGQLCVLAVQARDLKLCSLDGLKVLEPLCIPLIIAHGRSP